MSETVLPATHYRALLHDATTKETEHTGGIAVSTVPSVMPRKDGPGVFEEGELFSGLDTQGRAQACITIPASSYMLPSHTKADLQQATLPVLPEAQLPSGLEDVEAITPHLIVWWRRQSEQDDRADILTSANFTPEERHDLHQVIARQTVRAAHIIRNMTGQKPLIEGSWGHGTAEERAQEGKSRGGPTNKNGHLHVLNLDPAYLPLKPTTGLPAAERLNHYNPWNSITHQEVSTPVARVIGRYLDTVVPEHGGEVQPFSQFVRSERGASHYNHGYDIQFDRPMGFAQALDMFGEMGATFEQFYQTVCWQHAEYHKSMSNIATQTRAERDIIAAALDLGFNSNEAADLSRFALGVRPTYNQLIAWRSELTTAPGRTEDVTHINGLIQRYERLAARIGQSADKQLLRHSLINDTIRPPVNEPFRTWPVHLGAAFAINEYDIKEEKIDIHRLRLIPNIDATKSVEYIAGTIFKRSR